MLDTTIFNSILSSTAEVSLTLNGTLCIIGTSIILGFIISIVYMKTNRNSTNSIGFATTLIMLPIIISIIILLVGNNVARAFSLAGAFSIIRFRSAAGEPKDISYIFFTLAVGLACGMGYLGYAAIFTIILSIVMIVLYKTKYGEHKNKPITLKITIPENLNYEDTFNDVLNKYTTSWQIERIKTRDFGALFELNYAIYLKDKVETKQFIDELRCRNGNLNISLILSGSEEKKY